MELYWINVANSIKGPMLERVECTAKIGNEKERGEIRESEMPKGEECIFIYDYDVLCLECICSRKNK